MKETRRLVGAITPMVPTWAVYYVMEDKQLITEPVLFYSVWENSTHGKNLLDAIPTVFGRDYPIEEDGSTSNFIGMSLTPDPTREDFAGEIEAYEEKERRRVTAAAARPLPSKVS